MLIRLDHVTLERHHLLSGLRHTTVVDSRKYARPDISKAHYRLSEFLVNPSDRHLAAALQTLQYVIQSKHLGIEYQASSDHATSYIIEREPEPETSTAPQMLHSPKIKSLERAHKATYYSSTGDPLTRAQPYNDVSPNQLPSHS